MNKINPFLDEQVKILEILRELNSSISIAVNPQTNSITPESFANNLGRLFAILADIQANMMVTTHVLFRLFEKSYPHFTDQLVRDEINKNIRNDLENLIQQLSKELKIVQEKRTQAKILRPN